MRLGALVVVIAASGASHLFLAPSVCAALALTVATADEHVLVIMGAWLLGIVIAAFVRPPRK